MVNIGILVSVFSAVASAQLVDSTRSTSLEEIPIYVKPILGPESIPRLRGFIEYNKGSKAARFRRAEDDFNDKFTGVACLSLSDNADDCPSLIKIEPSIPESYYLDISPEGVISGVYEKQPETKGTVIKVSQTLSVSGPQVKAPIKLVDNKVPEPPVEKSFIQKYWIYIVPFLLMMMMSGNQQQQQQQQE